MLHWVYSATTGGEGERRGHNGGVWGWTSTEFDEYKGFTLSNTLHNVVVIGLKIGGSYLTTPRQAERDTLRNFFQRNYPYSWIGGRIAYDIAK
ncbi:hypothetical protein F5888DRAFT_1751824 [Russula emetica]|nr:hypothetical protein F5888DRAFT_1751824 [Russula emetica]